jgi:hypothetical protein
MNTSASILRENNLDLSMMNVLVLVFSALFLFGCDSYQVELDPAWNGDPTEPVDQTDTTDPSDPSAVEPTDDEPPWIELSDPDDTEPSEADNCASIDCTTFGPLCFDDLAVECCPPCAAGVERCHPESPLTYYSEVFVCAGGCWDTSTFCDENSYCKNGLDGESNCAPLPTDYDGTCEPGLEFVDPDCIACSPCDTLGESYCDHSGFSDMLIECKDVTGWGLLCWEFETCDSTQFESVCVADLATNFAACSDEGPIENFCGQFTCTGTTTCDGDSGSGGAPITDCGYCDKCCDMSFGPVCGYDTPYQGGSAAILYPREDLLCYEVETCTDFSTTEQFFCKMSYDGQPACELAGF